MTRGAAAGFRRAAERGREPASVPAVREGAGRAAERRGDAVNRLCEPADNFVYTPPHSTLFSTRRPVAKAGPARPDGRLRGPQLVTLGGQHLTRSLD